MIRTFKISIGLVLVILFTASVSIAQKNTESKFFAGGNVGLYFGQYTFVEIAPIVGYKFTETLHGGVGLDYTYYKYKEDGPLGTAGPTYSTSIYGGRIFSRFYFVQNLFLQGEIEALNLELPDLFEYNYKHKIVVERRWLESYLVGGGYRQVFDYDGPSLSIEVLFRLNDDFAQFYPYQNPIVRIGLGFGL